MSLIYQPLKDCEFLLVFEIQGVVTSAASLIESLVKKNPDEYKGCVSLAVSRLSRVRLFQTAGRDTYDMCFVIKLGSFPFKTIPKI